MFKENKEPLIVLNFYAERHLDGRTEVHAQTNTKDNNIVDGMVQAILDAVLQEILNKYDVPSASRMLTQHMIHILDKKDPVAADALRQLRKDSLPNLTH